MAKPGPSSMVRLTSRMKAREASSVEVVGPQQQERQADRDRAPARRRSSSSPTSAGSATRPAVLAGSGVAAPEQPLRERLADHRRQSRSSSLIEVFDRVRSSTVFTITAQ